jgi:hypothetical protein
MVIGYGEQVARNGETLEEILIVLDRERAWCMGRSVDLVGVPARAELVASAVDNEEWRCAIHRCRPVSIDKRIDVRQEPIVEVIA